MMRFLVTEKEHFHLTLIGVVFTSESIFTPMENHLVLVYQGEPSKTRGHFWPLFLFDFCCKPQFGNMIELIVVDKNVVVTLKT